MFNKNIKEIINAGSNKPKTCQGATGPTIPVADQWGNYGISGTYNSNWVNINFDQNPISSPEEDKAIRNFYEGKGKADGFNKDEDWIQTYSGRRFNPLNPNPESIVIQDIAHALSMQCRFSGHSKFFYSVGQHCVLVSHLCDHNNALWGLLHDASEAYLVDIPRPLKRSGKFDAYLGFESKMMEAICQRFNLPMQEPWSVKNADQKLLATEARDLMAPLHSDWQLGRKPFPFKIDPWSPERAKEEFLNRFVELTDNHTDYLK